MVLFLAARAPGIILNARCTSSLALRDPVLSLRALAALSLRAQALNAAPPPHNTGTLDIRLAESQGFIIADASGKPGFNPLNPGRRDPSARRAKDNQDRIGE